MDYKHKRRLVGMLVLIALAVILYPLFFGQPVDNERQAVSIPEPPPEVSVPDFIATLDKPAAVPDAPAEFQPPPLVESDAGPSLDKDGLPISWTLQLAAFSAQDNALKLQTRLRTDGYRAYTRQAVAEGKTLYRVYVGPELQRKKVVSFRTALATTYKLTGMIVRYRP